ncbi:MAG: hypothetical protein A2287_00825 [Candidatus Melainabacteria bacterium RIFOXYA12_FULL_32_12]|nr:MAG: hypothetical protein A2255_03700 [Candidatus Melainabacteria bacterium RIFOXYA2_FULL_32_9]OGI24754.1 MAG: hypothetical protein A2287_00825 [Candidatus Melainabacteria bacterium RIFOXYA12_FULL_32_12]
MLVITEKIDQILKEKELSRYKLSKLFNCSESAIHQMITGKISFSEKIMEKILPILEVSQEEFEGWILADKCSGKIIELALKAKKEIYNIHCHSERSEESQRSFENAQDDTHCHCEPPKKAWQSNNSSNKSSDISILTTKIDSILHAKGMSRTALSREIKYNQSALNKMILGRRSISKPVLEKLSVVLGVSQDEIMSWIIADKYTLKTLKSAFCFYLPKF